ncbi:MAG: hypothetical protein WDO73_16685 [Ignavibacteriota bacterium]
MLRPTYTIGLIFLTPLPLFGQGLSATSSSFSASPNGVVRGSATFSFGPYMLGTPKNAPYSGQSVTETKQTLVDGTNITRQMPGGGKTWRDSQGRVRTDGNRFGGGMLTRDGEPATVQIIDPVAGCVYVLDNVNHVAHRVQLGTVAENARPAPAYRPAVIPGGVAPVGASSGLVVGRGGGGGFAGVLGGIIGPVPAGVDGVGRQRLEVTTEDLGTKMIDGVLVAGIRRTTTIPEGAQGNDRPMKNTSETWVSKELRLTLLSIDYSPLNGTTTNKIENLSTAEPDPSLFMVPANYSIVDEKETFTIKWGEQ